MIIMPVKSPFWRKLEVVRCMDYVRNTPHNGLWTPLASNQATISAGRQRQLDLAIWPVAEVLKQCQLWQRRRRGLCQSRDG